MTPTLRSLALAAALVLGVPAMSAQAQTVPAVAFDGTLLSVSAQGEVRRVPDIAIVSAGVTTEAADANAAMRANAERMDKVVASIRAAGIAERDIQTSGINLSPQYHYGENVPPRISGYQATNTVSIKVRDIARTGRILDALVAVGANQIIGPSFDIDKKDEALDEARKDAIAKARARAELYAGTLGMRVRRIVSISEGGGMLPPPRPVPMMAMARAEKMAADTVVAPGENELALTLEVVFELGK